MKTCKKCKCQYTGSACKSRHKFLKRYVIKVNPYFQYSCDSPSKREKFLSLNKFVSKENVEVIKHTKSNDVLNSYTHLSFEYPITYQLLQRFKNEVPKFYEEDYNDFLEMRKDFKKSEVEIMKYKNVHKNFLNNLRDKQSLNDESLKNVLKYFQESSIQSFLYRLLTKKHLINNEILNSVFGSNDVQKIKTEFNHLACDRIKFKNIIKDKTVDEHEAIEESEEHEAIEDEEYEMSENEEDEMSENKEGEMNVDEKGETSEKRLKSNKKLINLQTNFQVYLQIISSGELNIFNVIKNRFSRNEEFTFVDFIKSVKKIGSSTEILQVSVDSKDTFQFRTNTRCGNYTQSIKLSK